MPNKAKYPMVCAFCGGSRSGRSDSEVEVTLRDVEGSQRQLFGTHASCITDAMADRFSVDVDALRGEPDR